MIDQAAKAGKSVEVQAAQYEGYTVWINSLIVGAGGQIADQGGDVKVDERRGTAAEIISRLAKSKAAPPGMATSKEDQARLGFETGRSDYQVNYTFIYPSAAEVKSPKDFQKRIGWARYPRTVADMPSRPPLGGINIGVGAYTKNRDLAFEAARCLAQPKNQVVASEKGGLPPTTESEYDNPKVKKALPFADLLRESIEEGAPRPVTPGLQRHLAGDPEDLPPARPHQARRDRRQAARPDGEGGRREDVLMSSQAGVAAPAAATGPGKKRIRDRTRSERKLAYMLCAPAVIAMLVVTGYPIGYAIYLSLQRFDLRFPDDKEFVGLSNYADVLTSTTWWSDVATHAAHHRGLGVDRARARDAHRTGDAPRDLRARSRARGDPHPVRNRDRGGGLRLALRVRPAQRLRAGHLPARRQRRASHEQAGSLIVIILAEVWKTTPFMALLLLAGLSLVPDELHEAAKVDGASTIQRFFRITLPLMKPAILVALLFRTLDAFRLFDTAFIQTGRRHRHRDGVDPRLQRPDQPGQPRPRVGHLRPHIHRGDPDRHVLREGPRHEHRAAARGGHMTHTPREKVLWSIAILMVVLYALIPVAWITSLSLKKPNELGDGKFFSGFSFENYEQIFSEDFFNAALINSLGIAGIATLISITLAAMAAYALARLDFAGKAVILSGVPRGRDVPAGVDRRLAVRHLARHRPLRHLARG